MGLPAHSAEQRLFAALSDMRLFAKGKNTLRFGTHAFRHSFTTRSLALGKTDDGVRQRTGHTSDELLRYREAARSLDDLNMGDVEPLVSASPELAGVHAVLTAEVLARSVKDSAESPQGGLEGGQTKTAAQRAAVVPNFLVEPRGIEPRTS